MKSYIKNIATFFGLAIMFTGCTFIVDPVQGPPGPAGNAFFGVDYDYAMPYSYWDNNRNIPNNPLLGQFYPTNAGVFDFEYFINPYEYWYGTYRIFRNAGGPGGPNGEIGRPGLDSYLMLICNPNGFYEERGSGKTEVPAAIGEMITIEREVGNDRIEIIMTKTNTSLRPTSNEPKYLNGQF